VLVVTKFSFNFKVRLIYRDSYWSLLADINPFACVLKFYLFVGNEST